MSTIRVEGHQRRTEAYKGVELGIVSYKLGDDYVCEIDNVSPGARLARAHGATREAAEAEALATAKARIDDPRASGAIAC